MKKYLDSVIWNGLKAILIFNDGSTETVIHKTQKDAQKSKDWLEACLVMEPAPANPNVFNYVKLKEV